jgi:ABC-type Fe3+-hydroxamate transport system substrate-binding protein
VLLVNGGDVKFNVPSDAPPTGVAYTLVVTPAVGAVVTVTTSPEHIVLLGPTAGTIGAGTGFTVTVALALPVVQPVTLVTVAVYVPLVETFMVCDVAPLDHEYAG